MEASEENTGARSIVQPRDVSTQGQNPGAISIVKPRDVSTQGQNTGVTLQNAMPLQNTEATPQNLARWEPYVTTPVEHV